MFKPSTQKRKKRTVIRQQSSSEISIESSVNDIEQDEGTNTITSKDESDDNANSIRSTGNLHRKRMKETRKRSLKKMINAQKVEDEMKKSNVATKLSTVSQKSKKKKKKNKTGISVVSFDFREEYEDNEDNSLDDENDGRKQKHKKKSRKNNKKRSKGMGFGGGFNARTYKDGEESMNDLGYHDNDDDMNGDQNITSMYGKEAMEALKKQQRKYVLTKPDTDSHKKGNQDEEIKVFSSESNVDNKDSPTMQHDLLTKNLINVNDDYIPLNSSYSKTSSFIPNKSINDGKTQNLSFCGTNSKIESNESYYNDKFNNEIDNNKELDNDNDNDDEWIKQIEKRSNVALKSGSSNDISQTQSSTMYMSSSIPSSKSQSQSQSQSQSLLKVKTIIVNTIQNLSDSQNQLESSLRIRKVELEDLTDVDSIVSKNEKEVHDNGTKFNFFQKLRIEIANYVGALREVDEKVDLIVKEMNNIIAEVGIKRTEEWKEEADDEIYMIQNPLNLNDEMFQIQIQEMIGKRKDTTNISRTNDFDNRQSQTVDEFGRDLSQLAMMGRNKRMGKRSNIRNKLTSLSSNCNLFDYAEEQIDKMIDLDYLDNIQLEEQNDRMTALINAIDVATVGSNIDEQYLSISSLCTLFNEWRTQNIDEYNQCYADLSLADIIGSLVKMELARDLDLLELNKKWKGNTIMTSTITDFDWYKQIQQIKKWKTIANVGHATIESSYETILCDILKKRIVPHFIYIIEKGYNPFSKAQSKTISNYFQSLMMTSVMDENEIYQLFHVVERCIRSNLDDLVLPILKICRNKNYHDSNLIDKKETFANQRIVFFIRQILKLKQLVVNLCQYWFPIFHKYTNKKVENKMIHNYDNNWISILVLMEIISKRILPSLVSVRDYENEMKSFSSNANEDRQETFSERTLKDIFVIVSELGWLKDDKLMIYGSPLRAAMLSFNITI